MRIFNISLTEEETRKAELFNRETDQIARQIKALFPPTTRGMLLFMAAMHVLRTSWPGLATPNAPQRVVEWIAAGEPEDISDVMERLKKEGRLEL